MHLADVLSKETCYSTFSLYIYCQYMCSLGIEPTTFALLTRCSTTEPQEHLTIIKPMFDYRDLKNTVNAAQFSSFVLCENTTEGRLLRERI